MEQTYHVTLLFESAPTEEAEERVRELFEKFLQELQDDDDIDTPIFNAEFELADSHL